MTEIETRIETVEAADAKAEENFVPAWLAVLVLVLLLSVMALGGYVIRGFVAGDRRAVTPEQVEIEKWSKQVKADPENIDAVLGLGYAYQQAGNYDRALEQYDAAIELDDKSTAALYNRGIVLRELGLSKESERAFWDVLEVQPDHALAAKALGEYYKSKGQYRSLVRAVRPVVQEHPEMADLQYLMGVAYENLGRNDWASARYKLALTYAPDLKEAREGLRRTEAAQ